MVFVPWHEYGTQTTSILTPMTRRRLSIQRKSLKCTLHGELWKTFCVSSKHLYTLLAGKQSRLQETNTTVESLTASLLPLILFPTFFQCTSHYTSRSTEWQISLKWQLPSVAYREKHTCKQNTLTPAIFEK